MAVRYLDNEIQLIKNRVYPIRYILQFFFGGVLLYSLPFLLSIPSQSFITIMIIIIGGILFVFSFSLLWDMIFPDSVVYSFIDRGLVHSVNDEIQQWIIKERISGYDISKENDKDYLEIDIISNPVEPEPDIRIYLESYIKTRNEEDDFFINLREHFRKYYGKK